MAGFQMSTEGYVVELDAETDVCPPVLRLNGAPVCETEATALADTALRVAACLPSSVTDPTKRVRRVRVELEWAW
jgi:hypothetical protein